jgi:hypothetical protein
VAADLFAGVPGDQDYGAVARRFLHLPDGPGAT